MTPHFPIYLDYGATTPVDPRVVDAMIPWLREHFGNPASRSHAWGWEAEEAVEKARAQVADLIGAVTIVNPADSYTLATEHSPLPLALRNDLAVPIRVRLHVDAPPGMTVTDVGELVLPPGYLPLRVPVEVRVNQHFVVDAALQTPDGLPLGESVRLSVHSNAYGMVLFLITMTAAAALTVLIGSRLWHRFRGQPDRADLPAPPPSPGAAR